MRSLVSSPAALSVVFISSKAMRGVVMVGLFPIGVVAA
jgi:hypothetical protein